MNEEQIAKLVNDNSKMSYTLGFVYGGLNEMVANANLTAEQYSQLMALLQLLHKNCNAIFYTNENLTKQNEST